MSKHRSLYIEGTKVLVSEEIYKMYYHFTRKERYFSEDLKWEKMIYDPTQQTVTLLPGREDSYERLLEQENQFPDPNAEIPEDLAIKNDLLERLSHALSVLTDEEFCVIELIFYSGVTEREASSALHLPLSTFHDRKNAILRRLRKIIEGSQ